MEFRMAAVKNCSGFLPLVLFYISSDNNFMLHVLKILQRNQTKNGSHQLILGVHVFRLCCGHDLSDVFTLLNSEMSTAFSSGECGD
jgi:hypothetical protein